MIILNEAAKLGSSLLLGCKKTYLHYKYFVNLSQ